MTSRRRLRLDDEDLEDDTGRGTRRRLSDDDTSSRRLNFGDEDISAPVSRSPPVRRRGRMYSAAAAAAATAIAETPSSIAIKMRSGEINIAITYLESLEFVGEDFSGLNFTDGKLKNSVFRNCTFNDAIFERTDLMNTKFINCNISKTKFDEVYLNNTLVNSCRIKDTNFNDSDLTSVKFINDTKMNTVLFSKCKWINNQFSSCKMNDVRFAGEGVPMKQCDFSDCKLTNVNFVSFTFDKCRIIGTEFNNCNFNESSMMNESTIMSTTFTECFLNNANATNTVINDCNFIRSELKNFVLNDGSIFDSRFVECNFLDAKFIKSLIEGTSITDTDLSSLVLTDTSFSNMNFDGSTLPEGIDIRSEEEEDEYDEDTEPYPDDYEEEEELEPEVMPSGMTRAQMAESIRARGLSAAASATSSEPSAPASESSGPKCYDVILYDDVNIQEHLSEDPENFVIGFPTREGYNYKCQSLTNLKRLNSDPDAGRGDDYYKVFHECKDSAPSLVQFSYNNWLLPNGRTFIKIEGTMVLLPPWFHDGPVPEPRVFVLEKRDPVFKFLSSSIVPTFPDGYSFVGIDHCNQTSPQDTYELVPYAVPSGGKRLHKQIRKRKTLKKLHHRAKNKKLNRKTKKMKANKAKKSKKHKGKHLQKNKKTHKTHKPKKTKK